MLNFLADGVFAVHGIFVVLAVPSTLLALSGIYRRKPWIWAVHNVCIAIMAAGTLAFGRCPLVELEDRLRSAANEPMPYTGSFVSYLVRSVSGLSMPAGSMFYISSAIAVFTLAALVLHLRPGRAPAAAPAAADY